MVESVKVPISLKAAPRRWMYAVTVGNNDERPRVQQIGNSTNSLFLHPRQRKQPPRQRIEVSSPACRSVSSHACNLPCQFTYCGLMALRTPPPAVVSRCVLYIQTTSRVPEKTQTPWKMMSVDPQRTDLGTLSKPVLTRVSFCSWRLSKGDLD